jgi:hypothetical protein
VRKVSMLLVAVTMFLAGVYVGIRMDWATWLASESKSPNGASILSSNGAAPAAPIYSFEVENLGPGTEGNLLVQNGDKIQLVRYPPDDANQTVFDFGKYWPCVEAKGTSTCTINAKALGTYSFSCDSQDRYQCSDPGIAVRPSQVPGYNLAAEPLSVDLVQVLRYNLHLDKRPTIYFLAR